MQRENDRPPEQREREAADERPESRAATAAADLDILRRLPYPCLLLSAEGVVLDASEDAAKLLGCPLRHMVGWPLLRFVTGASTATLLRLMFEVKRQEHCQALLELRGAQANFPVRLNCRSLPAPDGGRRLLVVLEDRRELQRLHEEAHLAKQLLETRVAERNQDLAATNDALRQKIEECGRLEIELRYRVQELDDADKAKDEFLAMLAHELRNPLAPIRNAVELLRLRRARDEQSQWAMSLIGRQVEHLRRLVDDLLDVGRVTRGKISLDRRRIDLHDVVAGAIELSQPLIETARQHVHLALPAEPLPLDGDRDRLTQVVANVLNNAAKYSEPGGRIRISAARRDGSLCLVVSDTGRGIAPALLPHIFEPFVQGPRSLARSQGGLGIGLTLARKLIELHGGTIHARNLEPGAEFEICLPTPGAESAAAAEPPAASEPGAPAEAGQHRVLVVDDNADAADALVALLRLEGHDAQVAFDADSALRLADGFHPDVLLLDIGLPGMDGRELARIFRAREDTRDALIVAVTGYGNRRDVEASAEAGFDLHLVKPVEPGVIEQLIAREFVAGARRRR